MHKGLTKLVIGGTLAVLVTLIVAGTASGRPSVDLIGYPKGVVGAPAGWTGPSSAKPQHGQTSLATTLVGYPRGVVGAPFLEAASSGVAPEHLRNSQVAVGYGSFPEVARTMNLAQASHTSASQSGFDWNNAGLGVGIGIGVLSILGLCFVGMRRYRSTPATA